MRVGTASRLLRQLRLLEQRIDAVWGNGRRHSRQRRELHREILRVLNGSGSFELIPQSVPNTLGLSERIQKRLAETHYALPRAIYQHAFYENGVEALIRRGQLHASEWHYVEDLARRINAPSSLGQDQLEEPPAWMADVDEAHQELRVWIRELALQDMLLAGLEAFLVPAGSGKPSTEIYGIVFGSLRVSKPTVTRPRGRSTVELNVERVCIQYRARGTPSEVTADERSEAAHLAMGEELFPYWQLVGDFHTHIYRDLDQLYRQRGWEYSRTDERFNIDWFRRLRALGHHPRVALILTITRAERVANRSVENWRGNAHVVRAAVGRCHCFIAGYRIRPDGRYSSEGISLRCPPLAGHG